MFYGDNLDDKVLKNEKVEVMALFSYGLNPCEVLKFQAKEGREITVQETRSRRLEFDEGQAIHVFEVTSGAEDYILEFDSNTLIWRASATL